MSSDTFQMSTGQAHELAMAFGRNGWTNADVKKLSKGDMAAQLLPVVRGQAEVKQLGQATPPVEASVPTRRAHYAEGEVFEMTLNGDAPENQPLEMVRRDGYTGRWTPNGPKVSGRQTRRFKWVAIGYQPNFEAVRTALAPHGKIPEGQWREAVKQMFEADGEHHRGIVDSSWVDPDGLAGFPCVHLGGRSRFDWTGDGFDGGWLWLVEGSE